MPLQLFVHIGPYKTGTTSVQEYFWHNRKHYVEQGLLYPKTGIFYDPWGHRHVLLAERFRPKLWRSLVEEIDLSGVKKILISSERLSIALSNLKEAKPFIQAYNPTMVMVLRDEATIVRSMYLQIIKGYFSVRDDERDVRISFHDWWLKARSRYVYGNMIHQWAKIFDPTHVKILVYPKEGGFNSVEEICKAMDVPFLGQRQDRNLSINPFSAYTAIMLSRFGWKAGAWGMKQAGRLERRIPRLKNIELPGYDAEEISTYYRNANASALAQFPSFAQKYMELHREI